MRRRFSLEIILNSEALFRLACILTRAANDWDLPRYLHGRIAGFFSIEAENSLREPVWINCCNWWRINDVDSSARRT